MANRFHYHARLGLFLTATLLASSPALMAQAAHASCARERTDASGDNKLRAAAEPFENLTELAFTARWAAIDQSLHEAERAVKQARRSLSAESARQLDAQISAVKSARSRRERADLALSAVEGYRILVSAVTNDAKIPTEVSLLDYSGFRYDADLKASPTRWDDMALAAAFAGKNWRALAPRVKGSPLAARFDKAITDMESAIANKDQSLAKSSVGSELDLVDELEGFFSKD